MIYNMKQFSKKQDKNIPINNNKQKNNKNLYVSKKIFKGLIEPLLLYGINILYVLQ